MGGAVESYIRCSLVRYEVPYSPIGGTWEVDWSLAGGSLKVPARSSRETRAVMHRTPKDTLQVPMVNQSNTNRTCSRGIIDTSTGSPRGHGRAGADEDTVERT